MAAKYCGHVPEATDDGQAVRPRPPIGLIAAAIAALIAVAAIATVNRDDVPRRTAGPIKVSGWAAYWQTDSSLATFTTNASFFSDVSLFAWSTVGAEEIRRETVDDAAPPAFRAAASKAGVAYLATIFDGMDKGGLAAVLADPLTRTRHVGALMKLVADGGFDGLDLDYENFAFLDGRDSWATTRPNWVAFITELAAALHAQDKLLVVSAPPIYDLGQTGDSGYWVYDFASIAAHVDKIRVMAYDYSTSEPGPIAPIDWVKQVITATKTMVPDDKIVLGIPMYGYAWVAAQNGSCPVDNEPRRRNLSVRSANELSATLNAQNGFAPVWDPATAERTVGYTEQLSGVDDAGAATTCTVTRTAWFLDERAIFERVALAYQANLAGVALWSLGNDSPGVWDAIELAGSGATQWPETAASDG